MAEPEPLTMLFDEPSGGEAVCTIALAHGAGAGMDSRFMTDMAKALSERAFRVARFEFPYMRERRKTGAKTRPDAASVLEKTWIDAVGRLGSPSTLVIGGHSMGGRIASMVADRLGVRGLVCMSYPFHPSGSPTVLRVSHLAKLETPTLILQGTRDSLGSREEIAGYALSPAIRIAYLGDGDHSWKPRKSSGRTYEENFAEGVRETVAFCKGLFGRE